MENSFLAIAGCVAGFGEAIGDDAKAIGSRADETWLECSESCLTIGCGCYWEYLNGKRTTNQKSIRVSISRQQQFTPAALAHLFDELQSGDWPQ